VLLRNLQELWDTAIHSAQENRIDNDRKSKQVFNKVATLQAHHHQMPKDRCTPDGFPKMNPMRRQLLISLLLLFLVARSAMAQTFPVQASTNIVPPYSTLLADYVAPGSQRLALNIFLADLNRPQLQTRLRLRIEGEGISITTRPSFMPPPLILQGGIPERLTGTDLAEYFLPQNLDFTGITRRQFESTGKLPEGLYRFCFEILEYNRGVKVSNAACTMAWLILNDPPLINWPDQGEKLTPQDPQYITFQWTPRHTGSPNSAFTTEYDFALVELWPANRNPNDAILTTPPIFETTTQSTTLIYGPEATPLVPGRSYAFRVRARAIIGTESYDLFKNQGYSEAIGFVYGDACTLPTNINARATSGERFNISWEPATVHTNFNVRYRPAIRTADQWYEETTFLQNLDIGGLMAETTYEYQVAAGCGPFLSEYSDIASVTTESRPPVNYTCGLPPKEYSFENREPLPQLNVDDVVLAGDFEVRMMEVSGSNGNFSGKGRALVPYLDNMLVVVEFDQVSVNTDYRMTGGQMDVKGFGADILPDGVNDFLDELDESLDAIENTLDDIATGLDVADSIADQVQDLANDILDDGPLTIEDEERLDAATVAMYLEGAQQAAEAAAGALAAALTPESIETAAREVARAMELTKRGRRLRQIHDNADTLDAIAVEFFASENYGFDISRYRQHRLHYNIMVTAGDETHRIPWVATAAGQQETVSARLTGNTGTDAADVAFESDGTALQATMTGDTWSITLPAMEAGAQRSIVALSSTTGAILGKLDAIAYEPIGRKVNLVPVGSTPAGLNAGDILTALNNTYRQAVASWEVAVLDPLTVDGYTGTLQDDEQALLSVYSTGMREIIRAFEATGAVNEDEFYLFLVDRSQVGNTGYMPRKHRYGFIYMEDNPDVPRTVAHELGHGAFRLQHTFEEYPTIGGPRSTANLMDYGTGTKLRKYQWDLIHNPPLVIGLLEDEGEGAMMFTGNSMLKVYKKKLTENEIQLRYQIGNWKSRIKDLGYSSDKMNDYQILLIIERDQHIVYAYSLELKNSDMVRWHFLVYAEFEQISKHNYDDFIIHLGIVQKEGLENETFKNWQISRGSQPGSTVIKNTNNSTYATFIDFVPAIDHGLTEAWFDWQQLSQEAKSITNLHSYMNVARLFKEQNYGIGEVFKDIEDPVQFLFDNSVVTTFLGTEVRVHWKFAEKLKLIENSLTDGSIKSGRYKTGDIIGIGIRPQYSSPSVSNHSYGVVVDIKPNYNHYISKSRRELVFFIEQLTGLNLFDKHNRSASLITKANIRFLELTQGIENYRALVEAYTRIDDYRTHEEPTYFLDQLSTSNPKTDLLSIRGDILTELLSRNRISLFYSKLKLLNELLNGTGTYSDLSYTIFNEENRQLLTTFAQAVETLTVSLSAIDDNPSDAQLAVLITSISPFPDLDLSAISNEMKRLVSEIKKYGFVSEDESRPFEAFAKLLYTKCAQKDFIRHIFTNGFCELPLELIEAFEKEKDIQWGGTWSGSNVDYMHFEIRKESIAKYLSQKKQ
jgi:TANFOR domain-containing protein